MKASRPDGLSGVERFLNVLFALAIIALAAIGLFYGELLIPGKRTSGPTGAAMSGPSAWLMYGAMACAVVALLTPVIAHHAAGGASASVHRLAQAAKILGWSLFFLALAVYVLGG